MRTIARILAPLLVLAGLIVGTQGNAQADAGRDYDSLTHEQAIAELKIADMNLNAAMGAANMWRESNNQQWRRASALEKELAAAHRATATAARDLEQANRQLAHTSDVARHWERAYDDAYAEALRFAAAYNDAVRATTAAHRTIARRDARIERLEATIARLKATR